MRETIFEKAIDRKYELILFADIIFTVILQFVILNSRPFASGTDGYYYAYQILSMQKKSAFSLPESSLTVYYLYFFSLFIKDIVLSNKIAVSLLKGFCILGIYLNIKNLFNRRTGVLASILISGSLLINYFTVEYVKIFGGIVIYLFFLNALIVLQKNTGKKNYIIAAVLLFASVFTHKVIVVFSIITVFCFLIKKLKPINSIIFIAGFILILFLVSIIVPNSLHYLDFIRFKNYFSISPSLPIFMFFDTANFSVISKIEISLYFIMSLTIFPVIIYRNKENQFVFLSLYIIYIILINPFAKVSSFNTTFRLFILIFIPSAFVLGFLLSKIRSRYIWLILIILIPVHLYNSRKIYNIHQHNYELYSDIIPLFDLPQNSLLIVHQGFDYLYWYKTGKKAFHYLPEKKHMDRPLYRLAYGVSKDLFSKYANSESEILYLPGFYALIDEKSWQHFLSNVPDDVKHSVLNWKNPHTYRENFLLRNQKFR